MLRTAKYTLKSCLVPMVMPRPEMTLLSGGYRKIPVMQYGADIYCDTRLISQKLITFLMT